MPTIIYVLNHFELVFGPVSRRLMRSVRLTHAEANIIAMGGFADVCPIAKMMLETANVSEIH